MKNISKSLAMFCMLLAAYNSTSKLITFFCLSIMLWMYSSVFKEERMQ
jgi:hypothetical protein